MPEREEMHQMPEPFTVRVRWWDGYFERFVVIEARAGSDLLWLKLADGDTRHIPLRHVRWFSGLY